MNRCDNLDFYCGGRCLKILELKCVRPYFVAAINTSKYAFHDSLSEKTRLRRIHRHEILKTFPKLQGKPQAASYGTSTTTSQARASSSLQGKREFVLGFGYRIRNWEHPIFVTRQFHRFLEVVSSLTFVLVLVLYGKIETWSHPTTVKNGD